MPKGKKPAPFMIFVKEKYPNLALDSAISKAAKEWEKLSVGEKAKYKDQCKKGQIFDIKPQEKLTSQGIPLSYLEKEKDDIEKQIRSMKSEIEEMVQSGDNVENLINTKFTFISVNYFSKEGSTYTPAEIALSIYSLKHGIHNKYHSLINPEVVPFGYAFETKQHSEDTHQLGIPPNVDGERNLGKLYLDVMDFIRENNKCGSNFPPLFTHQDHIKIVESVVNYLRRSCFGDDDGDDGYPILRVYPLHYLFYILKMTTSKIGETKSPESIHITNAYLDKDIYEYETGIACETHEKKDRSKFCSLSCVVRWAYSFSDHLCNDLALKIELGFHVPKNADLTVTDFLSDTTSNFSVITQPKIERSLSNFAESTTNSFEDFPSLQNSKHKKKNKRCDFNDTETSTNDIMPDIDEDLCYNPWSRTDRNKSDRQPSEASFSIGDANQSPSSIYRGRGTIINRSNENISSSRGRGLRFN